MTDCNICTRELDSADPTSRNCGGTCLRCMADAGDPECVNSMMELNDTFIQAVCAEHNVDKWLPLITKQRVADIMYDVIHDDDYDVYALSRDDIVGMITRLYSIVEEQERNAKVQDVMANSISSVIAMMESRGETKQ